VVTAAPSGPPNPPANIWGAHSSDFFPSSMGKMWKSFVGTCDCCPCSFEDVMQGCAGPVSRLSNKTQYASSRLGVVRDDRMVGSFEYFVQDQLGKGVVWRKEAVS